MDFDGAVMAHSQWKLKLSQYLAKPDKSLKPEVVCLDDQCPLGKWIHGDGHVHHQMPEHAKLKVEHAHFHKEAAEIIRKADKGAKMSDEIALGGGSPFSKASMAVVAAIMAMKSKVAKAAKVA